MASKKSINNDLAYMPRRVATWGIEKTARKRRCLQPLQPNNTRNSVSHLLVIPSVKEVWPRYNDLRAQAKLSAKHSTWFEILTGLGNPQPPPANPTSAVPPLEKFNISPETIEKPWNILSYCLILSIWCVKCGHDLREESFHVGKALYRA